MKKVSELTSASLWNTLDNIQTWGSLIVNVNSHGAKGDDVTDSTSAIQAALNEVNAAGGGVVVFPYSKKSYRAKNIVIYSNTIIECYGSTIKLTNDANRSNNDKLLITAPSATNIAIRDVILDGNINVVAGDPFTGCDLIHAIGASKLTLDNITVQNSLYVGVNIGDIDTAHIHGCKFLNMDASIISNSSYANNVFITGCLFDGHSASEPITISGDRLNTNIIITGNVILNKTNGLGINVGRESQYDTDDTSRSYKVVIAGNVIDNVSRGIKLTNVTGAAVYGNIIKNTGAYGISLDKIAKDIDIYDNLLDTIGLSPIDISNTTSGTIKVHHNTMKYPNSSNNASPDYSFIFTAGSSAGVANRVVEMWFENNKLYGGANSTSIQVYMTGKLRFNDNEYIPNAAEALALWFQTSTLVAKRNTNISFFGTMATTHDISNGYLAGTGVNFTASLTFSNRQGYDTAVIDNTVSSSTSTLTTIDAQRDGKELTLIIKKFTSTVCGLNNSGNLVLQTASYALASYTMAVFTFKCYGGKWYEMSHNIS